MNGECLLKQMHGNYIDVLEHTTPFWHMRLATSNSLNDLKEMRTIKRTVNKRAAPQAWYDEGEMELTCIFPDIRTEELHIASATHNIVGEAHNFSKKYIERGYCIKCMQFASEMHYIVGLQYGTRQDLRLDFIRTLRRFLQHFNEGCSLDEAET